MWEKFEGCSSVGDELRQDLLYQQGLLLENRCCSLAHPCTRVPLLGSPPSARQVHWLLSSPADNAAKHAKHESSRFLYEGRGWCVGITISHLIPARLQQGNANPPLQIWILFLVTKPTKFGLEPSKGQDFFRSLVHITRQKQQWALQIWDQYLKPKVMEGLHFVDTSPSAVLPLLLRLRDLRWRGHEQPFGESGWIPCRGFTRKENAQLGNSEASRWQKKNVGWYILKYLTSFFPLFRKNPQQRFLISSNVFQGNAEQPGWERVQAGKGGRSIPVEEVGEAGNSSRTVSQPSPVPTLTPPPARGEERGVYWGKHEQLEERFLLFIFLKKNKHQTNFGFV